MTSANLLSADAATVGIVANPLAGKDVRRLTSGATPVSDAVKIGAIRRALVGAFEGGADRVMISGDRAGLGSRAVAALTMAERAGGDSPASSLQASSRHGNWPNVEVLAPHGWHTGRDTQLVAAQFRDSGVGSVIALGGDGTQRDVAAGWRDVPLIPLAVGTNNVFPVQMEGTVAGFAAGAVASGLAVVSEVTSRAKVIDVTLDSDRSSEVALVDVCLVRGAFVGARAVRDANDVREIVVAIAEPASVGLSAIAAAISPLPRNEPGGVHVRLGDSGPEQMQHCTIRSSVMPGSYADIAVESSHLLNFGQPVKLAGPGVLTLDGEREIVLREGQVANVSVNPDGPQVIDVSKAVAAAQRQRYPFGPAAARR